MKSDLEILLRQVKKIKIQVCAGLTLQQSLHGVPPLKIKGELCESWVETRDKILHGQIPADDGLQSFIRRLQWEVDNQALQNKKTLGPKVQAAAISLICLLTMAASIYFLDIDVQKEAAVYLFSFSSIGAGIYWMRWMIHSFQKEFWYADWLSSLHQINASLSWGKALPTAFREEFLGSKKFPDLLQKNIDTLMECLSHHESFRLNKPKRTRLSLLNERALDELDFIAESHEKALSCHKSISIIVEEGESSFKELIELSAEKLSFKMMLPLFINFLPAYLLPLFVPILRMFHHS